MKKIKHPSRLILLVFFLMTALKPTYAQDCKTNEELDGLPGKYTDAAHYEWPAARASWFDELKTAANKATANKVLTQIEALEKESRKSFILTGAVLKNTFHGDEVGSINGKYAVAAYSMTLGVYEYFCARNKVTLNSEYTNAFRVYVNRLKDLTSAFNNFDDYNVTLQGFLRFKDKKLLEAMNAGVGFYQDVADEKVKQGSRNTFITRHWYITKPGIPLFVPITRAEYLQALLEFYDRELVVIKKNIAGLTGKHLVKYANYQSKYEAKKALVNTALRENKDAWLAQPAIVCPKPVTNWTYDKSLGWSDNGQGIADSEADGIKTGSFTYSGFWDDRGGDVLYKYNPAYFKNSSEAPAKPKLVELSFRYVKIPVGQRLVENFTKNFDFKAVQKMLE